MKRYCLSTMVAFAVCAGYLNPEVRAIESSQGKTSAVKKLTVSLDPSGFAQKTHVSVVPKVGSHPDEPPFMNGEPEHVRVTFDSDKMSDFTDYTQRQLLVYPIQPYAALFKGKEKVAFDKVVPELKQILAKKSDKTVKAIPMLPAAEAFEVFHKQAKYLKFKNGSGIAYLTAYAQDESPIKNGDFFYTFQGLSDDGKYYVSFFSPVTVKNLPASSTMKKTADYLGKLPGTQFTPSLDAIDHALQTISIGETAGTKSGGSDSKASAEEDHTIVPGTGIGIVKLGLNREQITKTLGKRDGAYSLPNGIKVEYSQWKEPGNNSTIRVFFDANGKAIQLNSTAPVPATADGISLKSSLADVMSKYKDLRRTKYTAKDAHITYLDDAKRGIAFEFTNARGEDSSKQRLYAIVVHVPGSQVIADADEKKAGE